MDNIKIVTSDPFAIAAGCLDAKLNRGRMSPLHSALDDIWDGSNIGRHRVVGAVLDGKYVGCATFTKRTKLVQVFVAEEHRRQGIGSALIASLEESIGIPRAEYNARSDDDSKAFFDSNRVCDMPSLFPISRDELAKIEQDPRALPRIIKKRRSEYRSAWLERISKSMKEM
jgi:GNAT superfamily N-acetyltransferase